LLGVTAFSYCVNNCSGHGACVVGECQCDAGFGGESCDEVQYVCPKNCSGHGLCEASVSEAGLVSFGCECELGFGGLDCSLVRGGCPANCTGHGTCFNGTCHCDSGFTRADCSFVVPTCSNNCSGHGSCTDGICSCHAGFQGTACDVVQGSVCPYNCTGHGSCDEMSGSCVCDSGYGGSACAMATDPCPNACSSRGNCQGDACVCLAGYGGADCSFTCPSRCNTPNGVCMDQACKCSSGWKGHDCSVPVRMVQMSQAILSPMSENGVFFSYPLSIVAISTVGLLLLVCVLGYCFNLCKGVRGTAAIPMYAWMSDSLSYSDYQLKRPPQSHMAQHM